MVSTFIVSTNEQTFDKILKIWYVITEKEVRLMNKIYVSIDLKSFYASVECRERGLDPNTTNLVVADKTRTSKTICLAVSPSLKKYGIPRKSKIIWSNTKSKPNKFWKKKKNRRIAIWRKILWRNRINKKSKIGARLYNSTSKNGILYEIQHENI